MLRHGFIADTTAFETSFEVVVNEFDAGTGMLLYVKFQNYAHTQSGIFTTPFLKHT